MKVLVTGGAGYIGSTLVPMLLNEGHEVRVLDNLLHGGRALLGVWPNSHFEFTKGDVRNPDDVAEAVEGIDAVVHLAAIVGDPACARDPELARETNLSGSLSVLEQSRQAGVDRFIFASTCSNYGRMSGPDQLVDETSELIPLSLYAETKVAVEESILDLQIQNFCPTVLRFATVFGVSPRMRFDLTVNEFTLDMINKGKLLVYGEQFWRPYAHVVDIARAILMVLEAPEDKVGNQVFNVGDTGQNYQKQQLVELIRPHAPGVKVDYVRKEEDPRDYRVSFDRIHEILGYEITHTVEDGIREVAELVQNGVIGQFDALEYKN